MPRSASPERQVVDTALVVRLVAEQFPSWAGLPVRPVAGGWDNRTFRLGDEMAVRLPSAEGYAAQVDKEQRWLPFLAPRLPLPVPVPVARGVPAEGYPFAWSVQRWLDGEDAGRAHVDDLGELATSLGAFLVALQRIDDTGGPPAGPHSAHRGAPVAVYDAETRRTVAALGKRIPGDQATAVWDAALAAPRHGPPVWFHGDVSPGNLLVRDGSLAAVIDFGCSGVGDPACDLTIAWTLLSGESREAFRRTLAPDTATWARARGWALWKALLVVAQHLDTGREEEVAARRVLRDVLADHERS